jgi:hypothetical protein
VSYVVDRALYDLAPWGYHATNILMHAAASAMLVLFLAGLGLTPLTAGLGSLLFGLQPLTLESVAWTAGRTDVLAALLMLMALVADMRRSGQHGARWRALSLAALALALFAKEVALITPVAMVLVAVAQREKLSQAIGRRWDAFVVLALFFLIRTHVVGTFGNNAGAPSLPWLTRLAGLAHLIALNLLPGMARIEYGSDLAAYVLLPSAIVGVALCIALARPAFRAMAREGIKSLQRIEVLLFVLASLAFVISAASVVIKSVLAMRLAYVMALFLMPALLLAWGLCEQPDRRILP